MHKIALAAAAFGLAFTATPALADGHEEAKPEMLKQDWYSVDFIKFEGGNRKRIGEIIDMFEKADEASGQSGPIVLHMNTGPWDMMVFSKMEHGIKQMGWASTPEGDAWDKAFFELAGGEEAAMKIFAEFQSYVAETEDHIGHIHPDEEDEG